MTGISGFDDPQTRVVSATYDDITVIDVYVPNGQSVGSDKFVYKLEMAGSFDALYRKSP